MCLFRREDKLCPLLNFMFIYCILSSVLKFGILNEGVLFSIFLSHDVVVGSVLEICFHICSWKWVLIIFFVVYIVLKMSVFSFRQRLNCCWCTVESCFCYLNISCVFVSVLVSIFPFERCAICIFFSFLWVVSLFPETFSYFYIFSGVPLAITVA